MIFYIISLLFPILVHTTLGELDLRVHSNWMEWDRAECFPLALEPNGFRLAPKQMKVSQLLRWKTALKR